MADTAGKVSFYSKTPTSCPVCGTNFPREELLTGRGRLIAGELTNELRRTYEPSKKFGEVHPLIYPVTVCPNCWYAAYQQDFSLVNQDGIVRLSEDGDHRQQSIGTIFPGLDFEAPRNLPEGVASYYLAVMCYDYFPASVTPTFKQGVSCLRAAWLLSDLHGIFPGKNYEYLSRLFYRKAAFFYSLAVDYEGNGKEAIANAGHLGPDLDKNYGYDGVLYLSALLEYRYGSDETPDLRVQALKRAKTTVARIFGMGRASKDKPTAILEKAKDLYAEISAELKSSTGTSDEPDGEP